MADPAAQTMKLNATLERVEVLLERLDKRLERFEALQLPSVVANATPSDATLERVEATPENDSADSASNDEATDSEQTSESETDAPKGKGRGKGK